MSKLFQKDIDLAPDNDSELESPSRTSFVNVNSGSVEIATINSSRKVLNFSRFKTPIYTNSINWSKQLDKLFSSVDFKSSVSGKQRYSITTLKTSLVPEPLFDKETIPATLGLGGTESDNFQFEQLADRKVFGVNALPDIVANLFEHPPTNSFVKWLNTLDNSEKPTGHICVLDKEFILVISDENEFKIVNTFSFTKGDDILFYLLSALDSIEVLHSNLSLTLWGEIEKGGSIHKLLAKYIGTISFGTRPKNLSYGYSLNKLNEHRFPFIFSVLCE